MFILLDGMIGSGERVMADGDPTKSHTNRPEELLLFIPQYFQRPIGNSEQSSVIGGGK